MPRKRKELSNPLAVRFSPSMKEEIEKMALEQDRDMSSVIRVLLQEAISRRRRQEKASKLTA